MLTSLALSLSLWSPSPCDPLEPCDVHAWYEEFGEVASVPAPGHYPPGRAAALAPEVDRDQCGELEAAELHDEDTDEADEQAENCGLY